MTDEEIVWAVKYAYNQGVIDALEQAATIVESYNTGAKHVVSKIHAEERKAEVAAAIRALKDKYEIK